MTLRCKPGDLAYVVKSTSRNEGRVVQVVRYFGRARFKDGSVRADCWLIRGRGLKTWSGAPFDSRARALGADGCMPDSWLRPIRPQSDDAHDPADVLVPTQEPVAA